MRALAYREELDANGNQGGVPTRQSLLIRLRKWSDNKSWMDFFDTYWRLIYKTARKARLNDAEAQDVVQDTLITVMKKIADFRYDPDKGTFKGWLLQLTRRRILDELRRKKRRELTWAQYGPKTGGNLEAEEAGVNMDLSDFPDPAGNQLEAIWDEEWESNLWDSALKKVKGRVDLNQYQIFDLYVVKGWKVSQIAKVMSVNPAQVYLIKHRVCKLLKQAFEEINTQADSII